MINNVRMIGLWLCLCVAMATMAANVLAQPVESPEARLKRLEGELRCLVCQNQTLADSNAPLAEDLRREVRELAASGKTDQQIRDYLVARYGDFILYKPPVKATTWLLWLGPFGLLLGGAVSWWFILRRRSKAEDASVITTVDSSRAKALLDEPELR